MGGRLEVSVDDSYQRELDRALPVWHHRERLTLHVAAPRTRAQELAPRL